MNKIKCYINKNYIDVKNNKSYQHIVLDSIQDDIVDSSDFIHNIKKYKLFSPIISNEIDIYLNHKIQEKDIFYYSKIFEELNCYKVNLCDTSKLILSPTLIDNDNYYIIFYEDNYMKIQPKYLPYFLEANNIKYLRIISDNRLIKNNKVKYYYYSNSNTYFL